MPTLQTTYLGELRTECKHLQSGTIILTDAPTDNQGRGEAFSPTDLVATALATCIITTMGLYAQREAIDLRNTVINTTKIMQASPRRIAEIAIEIKFPQNFQATTHQRELLERIANTCPVSASLSDEVKQTVTFIY